MRRQGEGLLMALLFRVLPYKYHIPPNFHKGPRAEGAGNWVAWAELQAVAEPRLTSLTRVS